jgi:hypothetical protein
MKQIGQAFFERQSIDHGYDCSEEKISNGADAV